LKDTLLWIRDFNRNMLSVSIKLKVTYPDEKAYLKRVNVLINEPKEMEFFRKHVSQGWRPHRQKIREIMGQLEESSSNKESEDGEL